MTIDNPWPTAIELRPRDEHSNERYHALALNTGNPKQFGEWDGNAWVINGRNYTPAEATKAGYRYLGVDWNRRQELKPRVFNHPK